MIPPRIIIQGDPHLCLRWIGYGKSQLNILRRQMSFQKLEQAVRQVKPLPNVLVSCGVSFNDSVIKISVVERREKEEKKELKKKIVEYKYLKVFVHVDTILKESWDYFQTETVTREHVTSPVACGVLNLASGAIIWNDVLMQEYLAEGTNVDWEGINGTISTDINAIIAYYDSLFPASAKYKIETENIVNYWMNNSFSPYWTGNVTGEINEIGLKSEYTSTVTWSEESFDGQVKEESHAPSGDWCTGTYYRGYMLGFVLPDDRMNPDVVFQYLSDADIYKDYTYVVTDGVFKCARNIKFRYEYYHQYAPAPYKYDTRFYLTHRWFESPILGIMWDGCLDSIQWTEVDTSPYTLTYEANDLRELRRTGSDSMSQNYYPCKASVTIPAVNYLLDIGQGLDANYILSNGFSWYYGTVGGLVHSFSLINEDGSLLEENTSIFRTLINFGAIAGKNLDPWVGNDSAILGKSIRELAKNAVELAGGAVYDNTTIPLRTETNDILFDWTDAVETNMMTYNTLLYASPTLNIRVYAVPVKSIREV